MHATFGEAGLVGEEDVGLATRAAWLYHAGGLTQMEVAGRLGVTGAKAHRLIGRATRAGLVRVFVEGPIGGCMAAETTIAERHGLSFCRVVPMLDEAGVPLRALGIAAATFLRNALSSGRHALVGVGHGRTLAAVVDHLPRVPAPGLRAVSLLGGLPRRHPAHPFEVMDRLADKTGAQAHLMPVPMFASVDADQAVLRRQAGVAEALSLARAASLLMFGIGEAQEHSFLAETGVLDTAELQGVRSAGAVAEALGYFYDAAGRLVDTPLHGRVTGLPLADLTAQAQPGRAVVAVAGGPGKAEAIAAVLRGGRLTGLITDELTARRLVGAIAQ